MSLKYLSNMKSEQNIAYFGRYQFEKIGK